MKYPKSIYQKFSIFLKAKKDDYLLFDFFLRKDYAIDKLHFIKDKQNYNGLNSIVLLTSEAGDISFWSLKIEKEERFFGKKKQITFQIILF